MIEMNKEMLVIGKVGAGAAGRGAGIGEANMDTKRLTRTPEYEEPDLIDGAEIMEDGAFVGVGFDAQESRGQEPCEWGCCEGAAPVAVSGSALVPCESGMGGYAAFASAQKYLTEQEEADLAQRLRRDNDLEAAKQLVLSHLRLVISIVRGYRGYGLPDDDLIQEGNVGLMKAVKRYEPSFKARLATYASVWIKAQIQEYIINNWKLVKIGSTKALKKLFFNLRKLQEKLGSGPGSSAKIASELGVEQSEVECAKGWFISQSAPAMLEDLDKPECAASFGRSAEDCAAESEAQEKIKGAVKAALGALNEREAKVIGSRQLAQTPATLSDLSKELGVSIERVRQIESAALRKLKEALAPYGHLAAG